jgi:hypothetical protein
MDYNLVKVDTIYLTDSGLVGGVPCRTEVAGLDALKFTQTGSNTNAADGTVFQFKVDNLGKGLLLEIRPFAIMKSVFDSINAVIQDSLDNDTIINITISGDTGDFDLDVLPSLPKPIEFPGTFFSEQIDGVVYRFLIDTVN